MTFLLALFAGLMLLVGAAGMVRPRAARATLPTLAPPEYVGRHRGTGRQTRTGVRRLRQQGVQ